MCTIWSVVVPSDLTTIWRMRVVSDLNKLWSCQLSRLSSCRLVGSWVIDLYLPGLFSSWLHRFGHEVIHQVPHPPLKPLLHPRTYDLFALRVSYSKLLQPTKWDFRSKFILIFGSLKLNLATKLATISPPPRQYRYQSRWRWSSRRASAFIRTLNSESLPQKLACNALAGRINISKFVNNWVDVHA